MRNDHITRLEVTNHRALAPLGEVQRNEKTEEGVQLILITRSRHWNVRRPLNPTRRTTQTSIMEGGGKPLADEALVVERKCRPPLWVVFREPAAGALELVTRPPQRGECEHRIGLDHLGARTELTRIRRSAKLCKKRPHCCAVAKHLVARSARQLHAAVP